MQVKKYRAKTIKEAIAKVKNILGTDAMILSTKKISRNDGCDIFEIAAIGGADDAADGSSNAIGELKQELMSIKEMLYLLNNSGGFLEKLIAYPGLLTIYSRLINNGVNERYVRYFFEKAGAFNGEFAENKNIVKKRALKEVMKAISVSNPFPISKSNRTISAFIGTTGVGKTTTIAKLAAMLMFEKKKKVGLISIDAYRIGAMEQLKTYANILGAPSFQAFKKKDLLFALRRMESRDVILIDTAGQSQYDLSRIEELRQLIPTDLSIDVHLLLSISTTASEMTETAVNFNPLQYRSYIFTKRDEARAYGSILNQIMEHHLPVSYITTGQSVPEDIEQADKEKILNLIVSK
jgi:flagellar biosynthesis protein FlhF